MKENKEKQIHLRVSDNEKIEILQAAKNSGYKNMSKFIIDLTINSISKKEFIDDESVVHTITISPTIDYFINLEDFNSFGKNSFLQSNGKFVLGGRGINTSRILKEFNIKTKAIHYSGGFSGEYLWQMLDDLSINQHRIKSPNSTRINVNVLNDNKTNFSLEQKSELISEYGKEQLLKYVKNNINKNDIVVISGSFRTDDSDYMEKLLNETKQINIPIYINLPGTNLKEMLKNIKPKFIILDRFNSLNEIKTKKEIKSFMNKFIEIGCEEVAYIIDANYSFFMNKEKTFMIESKEEKQISFIGLRDAFLAGIISNRNEVLVERLKWASSSQKAKSLDLYGITFNNILALKKEIKITEI